MKALLIDDHPLFREGLALLMNQAFEGVHCLQAATLAETLALGAQHPDLDLLLMDLHLPDSAGAAGVARLREALPGPMLIVLSADDAPATVLAAIDAGAQGFIPKTAQPGLMCDALALVLAGGIYLPPTVAQDTPASVGEPTQELARLEISDRQLDVLRLLIQGRSNKLIGRELDLAESTVKTHLAAVFRKLGVSTRTQAVLKAARLGLRVRA